MAIAYSPKDDKTTTSAPALLPSINLKKWVEQHRHEMVPPISNKYLYDGEDFFVMLINGPNARNDFHQSNSEEFFISSRATLSCASSRTGGSRTFPCARARRSSSRATSRTARPPAEHAGPRGGTKASAGRTEHLQFYCETTAIVSRGYRVRLQGHRCPFQAGDGRLLGRPENRSMCRELWDAGDETQADQADHVRAGREDRARAVMLMKIDIRFYADRRWLVQDRR